MENENFEVILDEEQANAALEKGMLYADAFVNKNYLINLDRYPLVALDPADKSDEYLRLYQIERIVYDVDENANDKMISVYSAFFNIQATGLLIIQSTRNELSFYLGVRSVENASTAEAILEKSFKGNFAGSQIQAVPQEKVERVLGAINKSGRFGNRQNVSSVSIVPSTRDEDKEQFVQGIEKFIDTMKGSEYTAVFIAEPLDKESLEQRKRGLQKIYSGLSPFASTQLSYGENYSKAVSKGMSKNFSKTLNDSLTDTTSNFKSTSSSRNKGHSFGFLGIGFNSGRSTGYSSGSSWASAVTRGTSETTGETITDTDTETTGDSRTITVTSENKSVKYILEKIDQHLARIKNCEAFGLWDIACYFVSENVQTSVVAASTYKALMAGFDSGVENSYVNVWKQDNAENTPAVLEYLRYCIHPRFIIPGDDELFSIESQTVNPCSLISGNEMPYIMGLPRHSVPGVTVLNMAEFGRNVRFSSGAPRGKKVELGQVYHMGEKETARVKLDLESFRSHCFITGSTGSGKSNTTYRILDEMIEHNIPFLVVEPAKGEYKRYYGKLPGIHVYCTNPRFYSMLHINPFRFNQGIHVLEHLDRLIEIFNACWPLYAAMPAILKESFERAYIKCGWDLENSIYIPNGHSKFPTFNDVLETLPEIINSSSYSSDSKGDYIGALVTRVKSLTNGISGQVLCSANDIDEEYLFDQNTIVDLSRVSSLETKSLLMGVLVLKLNEYRMCTSEENQPLRHVTVMEEAHNILKRSPSGGSEGANVQAKSVEMISSAIAEMRTYGEGFIIVDQSPTAVDVSAVKNTNTKIIMRLPDYEDCKIAGLSMGLNDSQIREISRFPMGVAVVYQNNWVEAVLTQIDKSEEQYHQGDLITDDYALSVIKGQLAVQLIFQYEIDGEFQLLCYLDIASVLNGFDFSYVNKYIKYVVSNINPSNQENNELQQKLLAILIFNDSKEEEKLMEETKQLENEGGEKVIPTPSDDNAVLEKLEALQQAMQGLQECFDSKIATDAHKNGLFDNMHKELTRYQNGAMDKIVDTIALDIIQLVDTTKGHFRVYEKKEPNEENYKRLLRIVKGITEDLQDILYRQSIEAYRVEGHEVDVRRQKIIQTIPTDDQSKDNLVAVRAADGYEKDGKVLRPERIKIFKYSTEATNNSDEN